MKLYSFGLLAALLSCALLSSALASVPTADPSVRNKAEGPPKGDFPIPRYSEAARTAGLEGQGTVQVTFDDHGKVVSVKVLSSSGSPIIAAEACAFIKKHWRATTQKGFSDTWRYYNARSPAGYHLPDPPPFPRSMLPLLVTGPLRLQVACNPQGRVTSVTILRSSGSKPLDEGVAEFIRKNWTVPPGKRQPVLIREYNLYRRVQ